MTKKIRDVLERQETENDFYKINNQFGKNEFTASLLYGASTLESTKYSTEHIENVLQSLAIQDSIIQEFENYIGYDGGNAVLSGFNTEYGLDRLMNGSKSSYRVAYSQACDRIGKRQQKNKNEKRMNKEGDVETIADYIQGDILDNTRLESLEHQYGQQLQQIKTAIDNGNQRQKAKAKKELASMLNHLEVDGLKFSERATSTKQTTRAKFKAIA